MVCRRHARLRSGSVGRRVYIDFEGLLAQVYGLITMCNLTIKHFGNSRRGWFAVGICLLLLSGCAHERPRLYPDPVVQRRGPAQVDRDIQACEDFAKANGIGYSRGGVGRRTVEGGVVGGAGGAAVGAIYGNAGRGAATGAAYGATTGFIRSLFTRDRPHPTYVRFVNRCLRDKGYDPIGWN